jgi:hypothetical protein
MKPVQRFVISVIAALAVNWCVGWAYLFLVPSHNWRTQALIAQIVSKVCGLAVGILAWRLTASPDTRLVRYSVTGACCTGFIGFLAGFLGPMIFTPHSNQGPCWASCLPGRSASLPELWGVRFIRCEEDPSLREIRLQQIKEASGMPERSPTGCSMTSGVIRLV